MQLNVLTNLVKYAYKYATARKKLERFRYAAICNWLLNSKMHQYVQLVDDVQTIMSKHILRFEDLRSDIQDNLIYNIDEMLTKQIFELCMSTNSTLTSMADQSLQISIHFFDVYTRADEIKGRMVLKVGDNVNDDKDSD